MATATPRRADWTYGEDGKRFPVHMGELWRAGPHLVACVDLTQELRRVMQRWPVQPKLIYTDPPWNTGMVRGFFTKAGRPKGPDYATVIGEILSCARTLACPAWMEASVHQRVPTEQLIYAFQGKIQDRFDIRYGRSPADLYQVTWGPEWSAPDDLTGRDDSVTPIICMSHAVAIGALRPGDVVLDTCVGLGLSAAGALAAGLTLYATELSPYRMSATLSRFWRAGLTPECLGSI